MLYAIILFQTGMVEYMSFSLIINPHLHTMGYVLDNSKGQLPCVCDLPDKVRFSQSDLTKITNSVTGFLSKAVI